MLAKVLPFIIDKKHSIKCFDGDPCGPRRPLELFGATLQVLHTYLLERLVERVVREPEPGREDTSELRACGQATHHLHLTGIRRLLEGALDDSVMIFSNPNASASAAFCALNSLLVQVKIVC